MQCLVVDDSKSARFTLKRALLNLGHEVITADSGENALEVLCAQSPDVIFMDHQMPGLDGFETAKKIRAQSNFAQTPIIMCTAKDGDEYAQEARRFGLNGTLPKPASEQQIRELLTSLATSKTPEHFEMPGQSTAQGVYQAVTAGISQEVTPVPDEQSRRSPVGKARQQSAPLSNNQQAPPDRVIPTLKQPIMRQDAPAETASQPLVLNDQLRSLIRAEAEGRAKDSAQRLLTDSWGRFRGNIQEDVRRQTREMFERHIESAMDNITEEVRRSINASLTAEFRSTLDRKIASAETQTQSGLQDLSIKINGLKRQLDLQKFDPLALQETILEDARRAAEYTATHKAVDIAAKIARELCEETIAEVLDKSILESFEQQLVEIHDVMNTQNSRAKTLTVVASFASVLAVFSFAVAVWALV